MNEPVQCPKCGSTAVRGDDFCGQCGHKLALLARYRLKQSGERFSTRYAKDVYGGNIKSGRTVILVVAIIMLITGFVFLAISDKGSEENTATAVASFIIAVIFLALWIWAKSQPFPASLTAFILYISLIGISAAFDPVTLVQGLLIKIAIVALLLRAITSSYKYKKLIEEGEVPEIQTGFRRSIPNPAEPEIPAETEIAKEQNAVIPEPTEETQNE